MYIRYGPCTQAAIFVKRDVFLEKLDEIDDTLEITDYKIALEDSTPSTSTSSHSNDPIMKDDSIGPNHVLENPSSVGNSKWSVLKSIKWPSIEDVDFNIHVRC